MFYNDKSGGGFGFTRTMLIRASIVFALFTIGVVSNHPLQDDPEVVEARRTQVLSESVRRFDRNDEIDDVETENDNIRERLTTKVPPRGKRTYQTTLRERKVFVDDKNYEKNEKEDGSSKETQPKIKATKIDISKSEDDFQERMINDGLSSNEEVESNDDKSKEVKNVRNRETSSSTFKNDQNVKTVNDDHRNYTRLEPIRSRKSSLGSNSSAFRRQRAPSHDFSDSRQDILDNPPEPVQNYKKRRRLHPTTSSTTLIPQTMPYSLYNHFRPLDQDVPQDHLIPFLDFGKKISPGIPPTPSGINSIENKSNSNQNYQRHRPREPTEFTHRSSLLDEDNIFHEEMDVTIQNKAVERNNVPRIKIQPIKDSYVSAYFKRRSNSTTENPNQISTTLKIIETTKSSKEKDVLSGIDKLNFKDDSSTAKNNLMEEEKVLQNKDIVTSNVSQPVGEEISSVDLKNSTNDLDNFELIDVEIVNNESPVSKLQKFERLKVVEPSSSITTIADSTTPSITSTSKRLLPVKLQILPKNSTVFTKNETDFAVKDTGYQKPNSDPLIHEESNFYVKTANYTKQPDLMKQIVTTLSPASEQLTTRILSTAVVTSVSVKEQQKINATYLKSSEDLTMKNESSQSNHPNTNLKKDSIQNNVDDQTNRKYQNNSTIKNIQLDKELLINEENVNNATKDEKRQDNDTVNQTRIGDDEFSQESSRKLNQHAPKTEAINNRTTPEDFIEVRRIATRRPRTTTVPSIIGENNSRRDYNKTFLTNTIYKPKIILPRTKVIIPSTTSKVTTTNPKAIRISTQPSLSESYDYNETSFLNFTKTPFNLLNNDSVNYSSVVSESSTALPIEKTSVNSSTKEEIVISRNATRVSNYKRTKSIPKMNDSKNNESIILEKVNETKLSVDEIIQMENRTEKSKLSEMDKEEPIKKEMKNNTQKVDVSDSPRILSANNLTLTSSVIPEDEIHDDVVEPDNETPPKMKESYQDKTTNVERSDDVKIHEISTTSKFPEVNSSTTVKSKSPKTTTINVTKAPSTTKSPMQLDHKWLHITDINRINNLTTTDGQNSSVGVAYQDSIHIVTYLFSGLSIIPILILALIVGRIFILRNRKKVLDESEYSSEYNRSPLGTTGSPLPTKLPRVAAHLGWEVEKNAPLPLVPPAPTRWEFPRDKLRLQTVLGQGNFGQVWKAEADDISGHEGLTRLVAVKTVKEGASNREREDLLRELGIMQELGSHPNVVTLLGCCTEKEPYLLIMEYVMYGKLLAFLRDHRTRAHYYNFSESTDALTSRDLTVFGYCVARGMDYLTTKGIIHRDIAARNVLVDHNKLCKIADFGMSRNVRDTGQIYEQRQSKGALPIRWMAPESLHFSLFTHKTDVWSFGILMWEIVTLGSTPYANMGAREVMRRVREGYRLDRPAHCHQELFRVIQRCWHSEPAKRPTFAELKHELGILLSDSERAGSYVDLESLAEDIKHHNHSAASSLQRPHNH